MVYPAEMLVFRGILRICESTEFSEVPCMRHGWGVYHWAVIERSICYSVVLGWKVGSCGPGDLPSGDELTPVSYSLGPVLEEITIKLLRISTGIAALCVMPQVGAGIIATDPASDFDVNPAGAALTESVGNIGLSAFNAVSGRTTVTFESEHGFSGVGNPDPTVALPSIGNSVSITRTSGGGFINRTSDSNTGFFSSGDEAVITNVSGLVFTFAAPVSHFGLMLNRSGITQNVSVSRIGLADEVFSLDPNSGGTNHSFFGFQSAANNIQSVTFANATPSTFIRSFDDVSFATAASVPEPGSVGLLALGAFGLFCHRRHRRQRCRAAEMSSFCSVQDANTKSVISLGRVHGGRQ